MNDNHIDFCDRKGALTIKAQIEAYWAKRPGGEALRVEIYPAGFSVTMRSARYDVRSNLVNGLLPSALPSQKRVAA